MVIPAEQNPVVGPHEVIAIKLPSDLQERLLAFPFLHALQERHPEAELHFITPHNQMEVLNLLPFKAYYHPYDEGEINSIFDVHRFCAVAKIYNVSLYICLTNSFVDACLGLGLRAKTRLGFGGGLKNSVFNQKIQRPIGHHISEDFFSLLKELEGTEINTKVRYMSRDLPPAIQDWDSAPYVAVNLFPLSDLSIGQEWFELLSDLNGQRIILFASEEQEKVQLMIEPFLARLPKENTYTFYLHKSWIELAKMLAYARGVITYNGSLATLSAYTGSKTIVLYDQEDPQRYGPFYFLGDSVVFDSKDPNVTKSSLNDGSLNARKTLNMQVVAIKAEEFFNLPLATAED